MDVIFLGAALQIVRPRKNAGMARCPSREAKKQTRLHPERIISMNKLGAARGCVYGLMIEAVVFIVLFLILKG